MCADGLTCKWPNFLLGGGSRFGYFQLLSTPPLFPSQFSFKRTVDVTRALCGEFRRMKGPRRPSGGNKLLGVTGVSLE